MNQLSKQPPKTQLLMFGKVRKTTLTEVNVGGYGRMQSSRADYYFHYRINHFVYIIFTDIQFTIMYDSKSIKSSHWRTCIQHIFSVFA